MGLVLVTEVSNAHTHNKMNKMETKPIQHKCI